MVATRLEAEMGRALAGAPASHVEAALGLLLELRGHDPSGALARGADARELARAVSGRMFDDATRWQEHLGPCFDVNGVREVLGAPGQPVSKQAVSQRRGLLALGGWSIRRSSSTATEWLPGSPRFSICCRSTSSRDGRWHRGS